MTTHPLPQAPGWGDECWVISPAETPAHCVAPVADLDEILEHPLQDLFTVPMMSGVEKFQDMVQDLPAPAPDTAARLDALMTPAPSTASGWSELMVWWLMGSAILTTIGLLAAVGYLIYDRRSIQ